MLGERQRSTESHPGQSECAGMGGWVDNVVRAKKKEREEGYKCYKNSRIHQLTGTLLQKANTASRQEITLALVKRQEAESG